MTKIQKAICVLLNICFLVLLCMLPQPRWTFENLYRQLPLYCFLENRSERYPAQTDKWTSELLITGNAKHLSAQVMSEAVWIEDTVKTDPIENTVNIGNKNENLDIQAALQPQPLIDLSLDCLADTDYLLENFYIVDSGTDADAVRINAAEFLEKDLSIKKNSSIPQILIYHSHSQETFVDSREGNIDDTIVGVGAYLTEILEKTYGYKVIHVTEAFDMAEGSLNRSSAYDYSRAYVEKVLAENPSIEVVIDLHRDGVAENRHLVTEINGKETAQIMFYNGLSYTNSYGKVDYLPNPYIQDNLAFSFQLEYQAALYYPDLYRGIYLAGLRYNLHLKPRALLLEAGAQTNTVQEVKNAMEPFAYILNEVLEKK